ncbi:hypothetical protein [Dysgonomonas sp. 216]|uniref:hypothetical protein n=1 Tax=Dysgonomonas sp. 216 TaxID=2302934 RepID=UPI0016263E65|nr:hypothetical protein [Dysgonomonas sp. 216]
MGRRLELEKEYDIVDKRIQEAPKDTPVSLLEAWRKELDSIAFELNNLYDDDENE